MGIIIREWCEILIQLYALLLYGGINVFDLESNVLSQEVNIVKAFSIILGCNCICAGILLSLYAIKHNILNGNVFISVNFAVDTVFELLYVLFPLIYLTSGDARGVFDLKSLGLLKQQNGFFVTQSLFAIVLLARKCWKLLYKLSPNSVASHFFRRMVDSRTGNQQKEKEQQSWVCVL